MRKTLVLACLLAVVSLTLPTHAVMAQEVAWRITALEGVVRVAQPGQVATMAHENEALRTGATVTTGASSRATIENGAQRIVMAANSRMTIAPSSGDGMTRILQDLGSLLFQVDHRGAPHFRVETPLLAAVVKGTTFTVSTGPQQDMVHVAQGLVEVRANQGGAVNDVGAGATARVQRNAPGAISLNTPGDAVSVVLASDAPALDYAAASGGVVEGPANANANAHGANANANANAGGNSANSAAGGNDGANWFGQSVAAVRRFVGSLSGGNGNAGGNGNGNPGGNGNGNAGGNGNGNAGGNGNGNGPPTQPVCHGKQCD